MHELYTIEMFFLQIFLRITFANGSMSATKIPALLAQDINLVCIVPNDRLDNVMWLRSESFDIVSFGSLVIMDTEAFKLQFKQMFTHKNFTNVQLAIVNFSANYTGIYSCQLDNDFVAVFDVFVAVPPTIMTNASQTNLTISEGGDISLSCRSVGEPQPVLSWYFAATQVIYEQCLNTICSLNLMNVSEKESGEWACEAQNIAGAATLRYFITVQYSPKLKLTAEREENNYKLTCTVNSSPSIRQSGNLSWFIDGKNVNLHTNSNMKLIEAISRTDPRMFTSTLVITNTDELTFIHDFKCKAFNSVGMMEQSIKNREKLMNKSISVTERSVAQIKRNRTTNSERRSNQAPQITLIVKQMQTQDDRNKSLQSFDNCATKDLAAISSSNSIKTLLIIVFVLYACT